MEVKPALALPGGLEVTEIEVVDGTLIITAASIQKAPCCPLCGTPATHIHSRFTRQIADLPCGGQFVRLLILVRKCFCKVTDHLPQPPILARQAMFLFLRRPEELSAEEQETLALLRSLQSEVDQAYELVQRFAQMVRMRTGQQLDAWLCHVKKSRIREFQGFAC